MIVAAPIVVIDENIAASIANTLVGLSKNTSVNLE
jgi:hypothetical protein